MDKAPQIEIYVDADACPVKDEVVRVAERHEIKVHMVSNQWMRLPDSYLVARVVVPEGPDVADNWIAERVGPLSIVITGDIPLADRAVKAGAAVLTSDGKAMTQANIGMIVATRNLMHDLREANIVSTYNKMFSKSDRSKFLEGLEHAVQSLKRRAVK